MKDSVPPSSPPTDVTSIDERYRLYIDESGDHVFKSMEEPGHRYLCLLGCWMKGCDYRPFHEAIERFKQRHIPHHPDEQIILHREDIVGKRRSFWRLRDPKTCQSFNEELLHLIRLARFLVTAIVIDKKALVQQYPDPAHPYHLALGFLLQRYCGYLNHVNRQGDVMAESRGRVEDTLLKDSYSRVYRRGVWKRRAEFFSQALSSCNLKLEKKGSNISGLQLADLLAHPVRHAILFESGLVSRQLTEFEAELMGIVEGKFNRHLYDGRTAGYGKVLFPKR